MLQLANLAASEQRRMERYQPAYQQVVQPMYQYDQRHMASGYAMSMDKSDSYMYQPSHQVDMAPVAPPTPPAEDMLKPQTLPSISSLLEMSQARRASNIAIAQQQNAQRQRQTSQQLHQQQQQQQQQPQYCDSNVAEQPAVTYAQTPAMSTRSNYSMPATPPLVHDTIQSPSAMSTNSTVSVAPTYYLPNGLNQMDNQNRSLSEPSIMKPHSLAIYQHQSSQYATSPQSISSASYYPSPVAQTSGMFAQRPLPSNFAATFGAPFGSSAANGLNIANASSWQHHHHYIGASGYSSYQQSQDRYVCPTCSKAFSRPSSLRIHSHSHTGEKPFKCSFSGCGKAFSVRSNMKRHERGCHGDRQACSS